MRAATKPARSRPDEGGKDRGALRDGDGDAVGQTRNKVVSGTDGADSLKGGRGDDRIFGFDGKNKSDDAGAIGAMLADLLSDEALGDLARAQGRRFVQEKFGLERMLDETLALYDRG